jgi:2',3'-cyclic-nucleotide 2'-phosphodiesterase (5'-nucleotidase family)
MIKPFNRMNVDVSCLGNHELETGIEEAVHLIKQTNNPWVMSNLIDLDKDNKPLADCEPYTIIEA